MKVENIASEDMLVTKWNVLEGMDSAEDIVAFLAAAYETPHDTAHIRSSIAIAMEAIKLYNIQMITREEATLLEQDAAAIKTALAAQDARAIA